MKGKKSIVKEKHFKLLVCNVYQDNRKTEKCLRCIRENDPDIIILVETDSWWKSQLAPLEEIYPYRVLKPLDNTYGMLMYSRLELIDPEVKYLVEEDIPSIHTRVRLPSGDLFHLYSVHPEPPVPQENPRSTERDAELLIVAKQAKGCQLPVIVAGDLNDVAWSYTTELFMKVSGLLDPRRGRGFYNTFHAKYWFLRWPLDHVFCSRHFQLFNLKRLDAMGSDHFPILIELELDYKRQEENGREEMHADAEEQEVAEEKIDKVK
jgi:endonuclease/exonuclease/phosphatase (EEP) superfamily protein YafD